MPLISCKYTSLYAECIIINKNGPDPRQADFQLRPASILRLLTLPDPRIPHGSSHINFPGTFRDQNAQSKFDRLIF